METPIAVGMGLNAVQRQVDIVVLNPALISLGVV